jgi:hypothetical protein
MTFWRTGILKESRTRSVFPLHSTFISSFSKAISNMADVLKVKNKFLGSSHYPGGYAVVGASKDETKIGSKVLKWYIDRDLKVTPVHPVSLSYSVPTR